MFNLDQLFGGKPWYQSMVGWGFLVFIAAETIIPQAGSMGLMDAGLVKTLMGYMNSASAILVTLGIRRRLPATGIIK